MRAASPRDQLQYMGDVVSLPVPKYALGTLIDPSRLSAKERAYYGKRILRSILRSTRAILNTLQLQGYLQEMKDKKMLPGNKAQIREKLAILASPDSVELAGMKPEGMHVTGTVGNQCYLRNGQCHSGVSFNYYLLFRKEVGGNKVVYIHPEPILREEYLKPLLVVDEPVAGAAA